MSKKILIVCAHPDDEVLGCGATCAKLAAEGHEIYTLILGEGKTSRDVDNSEEDIEILKAEVMLANRTIGVKEVFTANFADNRFDGVDILDIIKRIEKIIDYIKPDTIFTHHYGDMNIDHQITHQAVLTATRPMVGQCVKEIYTFEIASSTEWNSFSKENRFIPNTFVDVSSTIDIKVNAMAAYKSELCKYPHPRSLQFIKEMASYNGVRVGLEYSENFQLIRSVAKEF